MLARNGSTGRIYRRDTAGIWGDTIQVVATDGLMEDPWQKRPPPQQPWCATICS
jgi:hypothetical protein